MPTPFRKLMPEALYKLAFDHIRIVLQAGQKFWETLYTYDNNQLRAGRLIVYVGEKSYAAKIGIVLQVEMGPRLAKVRVIPGRHDTYPHKAFESVDLGDILCWLKVYSGKPSQMYRLFVSYVSGGLEKRETIRVDDNKDVLEIIKKNCETKGMDTGNENNYSYHIEKLKGKADV